jgi:hypothetical protein
MKIKRSQLQRIVREETIRHIVGLVEAGEHGVVDADEDNKKKDGEQEKKKDDDKKSNKSPSPSAPSEPKEPKELPVDDEPSDKDLEADVSTPESDLEADADGNGIGDQIQGMSVLSFTTEPKPKTGKSEIVIQFKEDPAPLRIIVMPGGDLMFAYKGAMTRSLTGGEG